MTPGPGDGTAPGTSGVSGRSGPPIWLAVIAAGGLLTGVVLLVLAILGVGVGIGGAAPTMAPAGDAAARTSDITTAALEAAAFQVQVPQTAYRPGESPALVNMPRRLLQVILPSDPQGGYIVVYELPTAVDADTAGKEFLHYLASGTGAIGYPRDTKFVLQRIVGTLVFYPWSAEVNPDPEVARLATVLATVGTTVTP
ncbi:MAG: hypothetical protein WCK58_09930 [Chloroflexota bacterium]